ncbi:MAG TPA: hypothetical protein VM241_00690 [Candidatus Thermoplasmatota archaeon]|nr:hypothetical protein [Candidatus Thermoplasmatota archaeon]
MAKPSVWVAFHDDGAWSVRCPQADGDDSDADDAGVLGWTSF